MLPELRGRWVLLIGQGVARAFGVQAGLLEWVEREGAWLAVVPHPSGVNRWWNELRNVERAAAFLRGCLAPEMES